MTSIKLHTPIIRNGVYFPVGAVLEVNSADADALAKYGNICSENADKSVQQVEEAAQAHPATTKSKGKK